MDNLDTTTHRDPDIDENKIAKALLDQETGALEFLAGDMHPADFSDQFEELTTDQREDLIERAPELITGDVLTELEDEVVEDILPLMSSSQLADAITDLDNDEATQIIEEMEDAQRDEVMEALAPADRASLQASLEFDEETIGRLMQREFVAAPPFWTVGDAVDHMRSSSEGLPDVFFNVYIVDTAFKPIGFVPVSKIMRNARDVTLQSIMVEDLVTIEQSMDQEDAAYLFEKYNLISAPVIDEAGRLSGMMTVDDIIEIIQDENKEDMLALAGVTESGLTDTALDTVKARAPWLFINLLTAILASLVIAQFDYAIEQIVALAVLMPIVASMGGNAGTQALTVAVRNLTEKDLNQRTSWRAVRREGYAAAMIGVIFAVALAAIAYIWFRDPQLAGVAFVAMIINHIFAGLAGILVPLGLKKFGADPAVASSVFVTTVTDIVGFFAFLGFAVLILLPA